MTMISNNPHIRLAALYKLNYKNSHAVFSYRPASKAPLATKGWYREDKWVSGEDGSSVFDPHKEPEWLPNLSYCLVPNRQGVPNWNPNDPSQETPSLGSRAFNRTV